MLYTRAHTAWANFVNDALESISEMIQVGACCNILSDRTVTDFPCRTDLKNFNARYTAASSPKLDGIVAMDLSQSPLVSCVCIQAPQPVDDASVSI